MIHRKYNKTARIGVFAVGHKKYWEQFDGLLVKLMSYHEIFINGVKKTGVEVIDFGMIDDSISSFNKLDEMKSSRLDLIFCNMVTYATSASFAPIIKNIDTPIILIALQPLPKMDYSIASTQMQLENDNICAVPEFTSVANRFSRKIHDVVIGMLENDDNAWAEINEWCGIAKVLNGLNGARIGLMGHVLDGMYDMHVDPNLIFSSFGVHVPLLEIDDLIKLYNTVTNSEITDRMNFIQNEFLFPEPKSDPITMKITNDDLTQAAKVSVALDKLVDEYELSGLAYYYEGLDDSVHQLVAGSLIVGNSMLNARGIPMCGEYDIKTCIAMFVMDRLGIGGSFAEFHPFDFVENYILVGHDGPHHIAIADSKPILRSLKKYHGKPGSGASVEFKIKEGPITMLSLTVNNNGKFKFVIGEGISEKGEIPPTGNTNTRAYYKPNTKEFVKKWVMEGPTHHFALGIGHKAETIRKIGAILGLDVAIPGKYSYTDDFK